MNKRGQFFILFAVIILAVVISIVAIRNSAISGGESISTRFNNNCNAIKSELAQAESYCFINGIDCSSYTSSIIGNYTKIKGYSYSKGSIKYDYLGDRFVCALD